jgi:hypothetical protein
VENRRNYASLPRIYIFKSLVFLLAKINLFSFLADSCNQTVLAVQTKLTAS